MTNNKLYVLPFLLLMVFAYGCTKKGNTGPTGPAGPAYTGAINGHVSLYDQYGGEVLTGLENISVSLDGRTVTTDKNGYYIFDSVRTGKYELKASGGSYGATMQNDINFISDTLYKHIKLSAKPTFNILSFKAFQNTASAYDSLVITVELDTRARNMIIFVNNNATVSSQPGSYLYSYVKAIPVAGNINPQTVVVKVPAGDLNNAGIFYGEQVYYAVYSYVVNDASVYEDPATGKNVYNAIGTTALTATTTCP